MATVTIQPSNKDVAIIQSLPNTNYNDQALIQIRSVSGGAGLSRSVCEFAVTWGTTIPNNANITAATLSLYYYNIGYSDPVDKTVDCNRMLRSDWVEGEATWNKYKETNTWTTAGCGSDGNDYTSTNVAQTTVPASYGWMNWNVLAQVQWAQTNSAQIRFFFKLNDEVSMSYDVQWYSREGSPGDTTLRPKLVITYSEVASAVTTQAVTAISGTTATGNGNVTTVGTAIQHGHCWKVYVSGVSPPTTADSKTQNGVPAATGAYTSAMTGLTAGIKYGVRAYINDASNTYYGAQTIFWANKGTVYPSEPLARATNLIHRYDARQEINQLEISLGDITSVLTPPFMESAARATADKQKVQDSTPIVETAVDKSISKAVVALKNYWSRKIPSYSANVTALQPESKPLTTKQLGLTQEELAKLANQPGIIELLRQLGKR